MDQLLTNTLKALQHLTNTARLKSYKKEDHSDIADLLDQVDYVFNLLAEVPIEWGRIQNIFESVGYKHKDFNPNALKIGLDQ